MRRNTIAILAASLMLPATALAQEAGRGGGGGFPSDTSLGPVVATNFTGGSIADYITALNHIAGDAAPTIMVRGDADAVALAPLELRNIHMYSALRLLDGVHTDQAGTQYLVETDNVAAGRGANAAFLVNIQSAGRGRTSAAQSHAEFLVVPIKEITTALPGDPPEAVVPAETVLTAVETALNITEGGGSSAKMSYHAESGLLILAGDDIALGTARQVVREISTDVRQRRERARELQAAQGLSNPNAVAQELADAQANLELEMVRMHTAEQRLAIGREELQELSLHVEAGHASTGELRQAELQLAEADAQIREHQIRVNRAQQHVQRLSDSLDRAKQLSAGGGPASQLEILQAENDMLRDRLAVLEAEMNRINSRNNRGGN